MIKKFLKKSSFKIGYIIRLDDIAPNMNWEMMNKVKKLFIEYDVKPILGVIPKNQDKELQSYPLCNFDFWEEIRSLKNQGWIIAMHGYEHSYNTFCKKIDYLGLGGNSEFVGHSLEAQIQKLTLGLEIFKKQNISVEVFFAPNHTFDQNTVKACKKLGFKSIIDGYGLRPYYKDEILFIPQLFYKLYTLPFGIQTIQLHINYFSNDDYLNFEKFVIKNHKKIISYEEACKTAKNRISDKVLRFLIRKTLQFKRVII
tara:strand:- start:56 stop:823 length:768 start_codon:yes stop_codon:yes gene_type:complete